MTKDEIQLQALNSWIDKGCQGVVVMTMGSGKSRVGIEAIKKTNPKKVLITSPRTNLKESWKKELSKWGIHNWDTFGEGNEYDIQCGDRINIDIINIQTCYKWHREVINQYDFIIIDEVHLCISPEFSSLIVKALQLNKKILGLTGTPNKSDGFKSQFYNTKLPIVFEYYDSAEDGLINKTIHYIFRYDLTDDFKVKVGTKTKTWTKGELSQYNYLSERYEKAKRNMAYLGADDFFKTSIEWMKGKDSNGVTYPKEYTDAGRGFFNAIRYRKEFLWNLESSKYYAKRFKDIILSNESNKILVFCALTQQANKMCRYSIHSNKSEEFNSKALQDFNEGNIREVSSCDMLTLGLNLKNAKYAIMESFNGSQVSASQRAGRLNRLDTNDLGICIWIVPKDTQAETWLDSALSNIPKDYIKEITNVNDFTL